MAVVHAPIEPALAAPARGTATAAHLRIHGDRARPPSALRRLWRLCLGQPEPARRTAPIGLRICDLDGHCLFAADGVGDCVDVELPAGTYHVIVDRGAATRTYTMALAPGRASDLHLGLKVAST